MNDATLLTDRSRPTVRLERHLVDPPDVVWLALTERDQLQAWFPSDVVVDEGTWRVGAPISFPFDPQVDVTLTGEVLEIDPPRLLAYTWGEEVLRFELSRDGAGTLLVLTDELPANAAARNAAGWDECLDRLLGVDPPAGAWRARFDAYAAQFEPLAGPQEGPPRGMSEH